MRDQENVRGITKLTSLTETHWLIHSITSDKSITVHDAIDEDIAIELV